MQLQTSRQSKQVFTLLLGVLLGLAIFISPYQLHYSSGSIFFNGVNQSKTMDHASHQHHEEAKDFRCLRCVLQSFEAPETVAPLIVIFVVLGFIKPAKLAEPVSLILPSKSARAPPANPF